HTRAAQSLRIANARQIRAPPRFHGHGLEVMRLVTIVAETGRTHWGLELERGIVVIDRDQTPGIGIRKRLEQYRVHHAEDRAVGADTEREREHDDDGKGRIAAQPPERVAQVVAESVHGGAPVQCRRGGAVTLRDRKGRVSCSDDASPARTIAASATGRASWPGPRKSRERQLCSLTSL